MCKKLFEITSFYFFTFVYKFQLFLQTKANIGSFNNYGYLIKCLQIWSAMKVLRMKVFDVFNVMFEEKWFAPNI